MQLDIGGRSQLDRSNRCIRRHIGCIALITGMLLACCTTASAEGAGNSRLHDGSGPHTVAERQSETPIGQGWMEPDGTVVLDLRRTSDGINISMPPQRFSPSHPRYREVLQHVGPLRPGEHKLVYPWPEQRP